MKTIHTRRHVLAGTLSALAAVPATASGKLIISPPEAVAADPIFAAIERCRAAAATYGKVMDWWNTVEEAVMDDARANNTRTREDARMVEADKIYHTAANAYDDLAWELVEITPTTHAGTVALAAYGLESFESDIAPPEDGGEERGLEYDRWTDALLCAIASGLGGVT
jgi:hypothetical protein